jgi:hypothetical protein|tara:strand:+ start:493 stop:726 length:234 start_codon:yes stop_codon:yes gene_type:complete
MVESGVLEPLIIIVQIQMYPIAVAAVAVDGRLMVLVAQEAVELGVLRLLMAVTIQVVAEVVLEAEVVLVEHEVVQES